jgi:hypothetical protein
LHGPRDGVSQRHVNQIAGVGGQFGLDIGGWQDVLRHGCDRRCSLGKAQGWSALIRKKMGRREVKEKECEQ